jgi:hypothetical protein
MAKVLFFWAACIALLLCAAPAVAQGKAATEEELAAARQLFNEALNDEKAHRWEVALGKLEKVGRVKMTPHVRFHIALCHEHLGRLVEAINGFELAEQEARAMGESAKSVADNAPDRAGKLRDRVAHVRITVKGRATVSKILLDGREVSLALVDTAIPVDPGNHRVEVRRDGVVKSEEQLALAEGQSETVTLTIDDPEPPPPVPEPYPVPNGQKPPPGPKPDPNREQGPPNEMARLPAYVVGGAGGLMLITSGVLWGLRQSEIAKVECDDPENFTGCELNDRDKVEQAERYDIASKVMLGVGAAALATGVVLWFVLAPEGAVGSFSGLGVAPRLGGASLVGRF